MYLAKLSSPQLFDHLEICECERSDTRIGETPVSKTLHTLVHRLFLARLLDFLFFFHTVVFFLLNRFLLLEPLQV